MAEQTALPYSGKMVRSSHVGFNEDGDEDDNQPIAGSTSSGPRGPTPNNKDGRDDAVFSFWISDTMYDQNLQKSPLLAMSTQLLPMLSCSHLHRLQSIIQLRISPHG